MPDKTELINCPACNHKVSKEYCFVCPKCNYQVKEPTPENKAERHTIAENETCKDSEKTEEYLLTEIHEESLDRTRLPSETVSRTMARFAALLINLSKGSAETTDKNILLGTHPIYYLSPFFGLPRDLNFRYPIKFPLHFLYKTFTANGTTTPCKAELSSCMIPYVVYIFII